MDIKEKKKVLNNCHGVVDMNMQIKVNVEVVCFKVMVVAMVPVAAHLFSLSLQ